MFGVLFYDYANALIYYVLNCEKKYLNAPNEKMYQKNVLYVQTSGKIYKFAT